MLIGASVHCDPVADVHLFFISANSGKEMKMRMISNVFPLVSHRVIDDPGHCAAHFLIHLFCNGAVYAIIKYLDMQAEI